MMGALKGEFFQILNKNSLSLADCAINRSFTVVSFFNGMANNLH